MKFTEGYWLRSEKVQASYVMQAFYVEKTSSGMRMFAPERPITRRCDAQNITTLIVDFTAFAPNNIAVSIKHYEGYQNKEARFKLMGAQVPYEVEINEAFALMTCGELAVRIDRKSGSYRFETNGKIITSCDFRNQGYIRYDKQPSTMRPAANYLSDLYTPYMVTELSLKAGERVYGFGEQFTAFCKNGQVVECWNEDGGTSSDVAYKNIPFYVTSEGYGVYVDHMMPVSFEVASEKVEYVGFSVEGEELRYHFIYGPTIKEVVERYTNMTGKPALPPAWSFGLWLTTSFTTNYNEATTSSFIDGMAERRIPLHVFHFDVYWMKALRWCGFEWDDETFGDVPTMLKRYKEEKGLHICAWVNPYIAGGTSLFYEGLEKQYFVRRKDGKGIKQTDFWQPGLAFVDFTNPEATKWYTSKIKALLEVGVDCVKTDFGERIPIDVMYEDGSDPVSMHNYYTYLYNQAVFKAIQEVKKDNEVMVFARSATVGSQQFPIHWGGDCSANYPSMAETLRGGLSLALSGFSYWSHDISGFEQTATPDLYKRWVQFGLLSSHSRLHGSSSYRVPWLFDEEACDVLRYFVNLKCMLMPYIYQMAVISHQTGIPLLRPMVMEFEKDRGTKDLDMQYMLGDSLLVAPIFNEEGRGCFYLPEGSWTYYFTGQVYEGGRWYEETYDYFHLPLFVRENTLLPVGKNKEKPDYDFCEGIELHLYQLQDKCQVVCKVPNLKGEVVLQVEARREGNKLSVKLNTLLGEPTLIIHSEHGNKEPRNIQLKGKEVEIIMD
ncbi:alpha-xylosidase [Sporanaerobium hydrogeniformans]|uniref:Alpha-xylosidase n=1 Tax=Sporanaerobium hydrogeniformans TaxID=3072179 RepID=A0AC61DBE3_9FIRM|nr:alpha-xylosidase [Sporanaerobium hydrogeniformans]PHV69917.1 alpha-xylosidase [Sporanaerobium hydrogeniformans]